MGFNDVCPCSIEGLQIISELQNIHAVVNAEMSLDLIYRICQQGEAMMQCKSCMQLPQPSIVILPALSEKYLSLLEALYSTYDIATQPGFFDSAMLAMEHPTSRFICIRNTVLLGQLELEEEETKLLVDNLTEAEETVIFNGESGWLSIGDARKFTFASKWNFDIAQYHVFGRFCHQQAESFEGDCLRKRYYSVGLIFFGWVFI